ncbi:MAG: hypothetical protein D6791_09080, partial [Chloroflexi bacterium]
MMAGSIQSSSMARMSRGRCAGPKWTPTSRRYRRIPAYATRWWCSSAKLPATVGLSSWDATSGQWFCRMRTSR